MSAATEEGGRGEGREQEGKDGGARERVSAVRGPAGAGVGERRREGQ